MFYNFTLTVPANTAETSPATTELKLTKGVLHRVEIQFPIGTRALVHVQIYRGAYQLWPTNTEEDFCSDGYVIAWDEHEEISDEPTLFTAKGWSTADTYDYDIDIRIGILPKEAVSPFTGIVGALQKFLRFMGVGV